MTRFDLAGFPGLFLFLLGRQFYKTRCNKTTQLVQVAMIQCVFSN